MSLSISKSRRAGAKAPYQMAALNVPRPTPVAPTPKPPMLSIQTTPTGLKMVMEYDGKTVTGRISRGDAVRLHDEIHKLYVLGASTTSFAR